SEGRRVEAERIDRPRGARRVGVARARDPEPRRGADEGMNPIDEHRLLLTRRELFRKGALGLGGAALGTLLARDAAASGGALPGLPHFAPKAKRVIYLFMNGAATHVDLFDWKPRLQEMHGK